MCTGALLFVLYVILEKIQVKVMTNTLFLFASQTVDKIKEIIVQLHGFLTA